MSTAVGVMMVVIGVCSLLLSVLMGRRAPSRDRAAAGRGDAAASGTPLERSDAALDEPDVTASRAEDVEAEEAAVPQPRSEPVRESAAAAAVPATGASVTPSPVEHPAPEPAPIAKDEGSSIAARLETLQAELVGGPEPEPEAPAEASPRADAARIFGAVASVGRAPEVQERGAGHQHALPLFDVGDLLAHLGREHPGLEPSGSMMQARILHERAHASSD